MSGSALGERSEDEKKDKRKMKFGKICNEERVLASGPAAEEGLRETAHQNAAKEDEETSEHSF